MAYARDKVVRVESLTPTGGGVHFDDENLLHLGANKRTSKIIRNDLEDDIQLGESALEEEDVLCPLPDGWPKIPQLFKRRSWNFSTATSPSVNKAVSHLELLQNTLEEWSKEVETEIMSRASSRMKSRAASSASTVGMGHLDTQVLPSMGPGSVVSRRQLRFMSPSVVTSAKSTTSRTTRTSQQTPGKLSIEGIGAMADDDDADSKITELEEVTLEVPYLGAEEVLDEVMTLLARMDNERRGAREKLATEKNRIGMLQGRIDQLARTRMSEFAESVQNEHEACSMDINELNWHVSYRSRIESRIKNKVAIAEVLNSRLKEDIEFVKKHCPLVQEKLELEREAMERIKQAQHDTNDELSVTVDRCAKVETKSEEAYTKADVERNHLQLEVEGVRTELANINQELSEEKMLFNSYIHQCNDFRQQLGDNQQELMVLEVKNENAKAAEEMQHAKIRDLQGKIVEQEFEYRKHVDTMNRHQSALDQQRSANRKAEEDRVNDIKEKDNHLRKLTLTNDELEMDIEDAITNIEKCDKQRIADDKNLVRMEKEQVRTHEQIKVTEDELAKIRAINNAIREKLEKEEERCAAEEDGLKATCEQLRKQIKDEIHSRTVIQARISADNNDLAKSQAEAKQKKEKMTKKANEVEAQVQNVLTKVEKLRVAHDERQKVLTALKKEIDETDDKREKLDKGHTEVKAEVLPKHEKSTNDLAAVKKQLEHMDWKTQMMKKNMDDMTASFKMMSRSMATTQKTIDRLQDEYDELNVDMISNQHLDEQVKQSVKALTKRIQEAEMRHQKMLRERSEAFNQHETDLVANMSNNKVLASKYRVLQNEFLKVKNEMLNRYEERLKLETTIKDLKQIQSLQKRMHSALYEYYKLRGMYNTSELGRMETESSQNALKVGDLKFEMDGALDSISHFLSSQMDGTTARRIAMEKALLEETGQHIKLKIGSNGAPSEIQSIASRSVSENGPTPAVSGVPLIQISRPPTGAIAVQ